MNIQIIRDNLKNTISGKEKYLAEMKENYQLSTMAEGMALTATIEFLEINLTELKRILQDVEQCVPKEPEFDESDSEEVRNLIRMGR
jgi:hypothetical protein